MRVIALIDDPAVIRRILTHVGAWRERKGNESGTAPLPIVRGINGFYEGGGGGPQPRDPFCRRREDLLATTAVQGAACQVALAALQMKAGSMAMEESGVRVTSRAVFGVPGH
jgi:hypothetical protein